MLNFHLKSRSLSLHRQQNIGGKFKYKILITVANKAKNNEVIEIYLMKEFKMCTKCNSYVM